MHVQAWSRAPDGMLLENSRDFYAAEEARLPRGEALSGNADGQPHSELVEFPTVDPSGAPLAEGHVFYRGQSMLRRVAEQLARIDRQAREMDRFK